jgi:hypothetical protein
MTYSILPLMAAALAECVWEIYCAFRHKNQATPLIDRCLIFITAKGRQFPQARALAYLKVQPTELEDEERIETKSLFPIGHALDGKGKYAHGPNTQYPHILVQPLNLNINLICIK